jgi:preprotein translocase subunit SecE
LWAIGRDAPRSPKGRQMTTTANERDNAGNERLRAKNPVEFFAQVRQEGRRVTWATRQEVTVSTIMVLVMVLAAIIFFALVDGALGFLVSNLIFRQ